MIVYGRNPVREALRGRRRVHRVYATEKAATEVWLGDVEVTIAEPHDIEERCGSADHQGVCAEAQAYPYADADALLDSEDGLSCASTRCRTRTTSALSAGWPRRPAARGW